MHEVRCAIVLSPLRGFAVFGRLFPRLKPGAIFGLSLRDTGKARSEFGLSVRNEGEARSEFGLSLWDTGEARSENGAELFNDILVHTIRAF